MAIATRPAERHRVSVQRRVEAMMDLQESARRIIRMDAHRDELILRKEWDDARLVHRAIKDRLNDHLEQLVQTTPLLTGEWPL